MLLAGFLLFKQLLLLRKCRFIFCGIDLLEVLVKYLFADCRTQTARLTLDVLRRQRVGVTDASASIGRRT